MYKHYTTCKAINKKTRLPENSGGAFLFYPSLPNHRLDHKQMIQGRPPYMQVDLIFKIAAIGILVAVLNQLLIRSGREEQAMMTVLAGLIVVLMILLQEINNLFNMVKTLFGF